LTANWCIATSTGLLAPLLYGYARVSSKDQEYNGQIDALSHAGCAKILAEKISGARADNRKELAKVLKALAAGDTLIVTRLDRLARSTRDLLNTLDAVAKAGAAFKSLADIWADTTTPHGKLMLTVLGGLAEFERTLIRSRTDEGRKRALAARIRFGRKPKLTPYQRKEALERLADGEAQLAIARTMGVDRSTISRLQSI